MPDPVIDTLKAARAAPPTLEETAALAGYLHAGQVDKAGRPYIGHLVRVSRHLLRLFPDASPDERHAAWLHDAVEDTGTTPEDLRALGYPETVIAIVLAVTKAPDPSMTYADRIDNLARTAPIAALRVKLADLSDNADPVRLAQLPDSRAASMGARYGAAIARLEEALAARA